MSVGVKSDGGDVSEYGWENGYGYGYVMSPWMMRHD